MAQMKPKLAINQVAIVLHSASFSVAAQCIGDSFPSGDTQQLQLALLERLEDVKDSPLPQAIELCALKQLKLVLPPTSAQS